MSQNLPHKKIIKEKEAKEEYLKLKKYLGYLHYL